MDARLNGGGGLSGTNAIPVNGAGGLTSQLGLPAGTITFAGAIPLGCGSSYPMSFGSLNDGKQVGFSYDFMAAEGGTTVLTERLDDRPTSFESPRGALQ